MQVGMFCCVGLLAAGAFGGGETDWLTISSNLAVTVAVTGLEESLGLSVGQSTGTSREVLQEQSEDKQRWNISPAAIHQDLL